MNRFAERHRRFRIAAFVATEYPRADQAATYEELDRLGDAIDAEVGVFYSRVPDPRSVDDTMRPLVGGGYFVPDNPMLQAEDLEHQWRTRRQRFDTMASSLARLAHQSVAGVLTRRDVRIAMSQARMVQAFDADMVYSRGLGESSVSALLSAYLLELPLLVDPTDVEAEPTYAPLLPLLTEHATTVLVDPGAGEADVVARCGAEVRAKLLLREGEDGLTRAAKRCLEAIAPGRNVAMGPDAAFTTGCPGNPCPPSTARPFLVIGAERTGSTLLVDLISSSPQIACTDEVFNPRSIQSGLLPWLRSSTRSRDDLKALRLADPAGLHALLMQDGADEGAAWVGFKLLYGHGAADQRVVSHLVADRDLAVIHIRRRHRLRRWLSYCRAELTDEWYSRDRKSSAPPLRMHLDLMTVLMDFATTEVLEDRFASIFRNHRVLELDYEEFSRDFERTTYVTGEFFGLELGKLSPRSKKSAATTLADSVTNFDELESALRGTRWARFLDEDADE